MDSTAAPVERTQPSQFVRTERPGVMSQFNLQSPRVWLIIACVAAVFAWMIFAHRSHSSSNDVGAIAARQAVPVSAVAAKRGDLNLFINAISTITPFNTVTVKSRVDGELVRVLFKEGQMVKQGDLLAEIDLRPYQVQLTQAEGQMARDRANLDNARILYERDKELLRENVIARQDLDNQASLVGQSEGAVKNDQGLIEAAKLNLVYTKITSPISGRVGLRLVDPGNIIHASDANGLMVITQLQPIAAIFSIPEDDLPRVEAALRLNPHPPVDVYDRDFTTKLATGFLLTTDNEIDQTTGTVKLKAQFANDDFALFPNQFVNAQLLVDTKKDTVLVPTAAVQRGGAQGTFVYVVQQDQTVAMRPVKVAAAQGDLSAIASGVEPGEIIVTDGVDKLRQGSKVSVQLAANPVKPGATQ